VGDEEQREPHGLLEFTEEVHCLRLGGDVQSGGRLVLGLEREYPGDPDTLALTIRELVRVARLCARARVLPARATLRPCLDVKTFPEAVDEGSLGAPGPSCAGRATNRGPGRS